MLSPILGEASRRPVPVPAPAAPPLFLDLIDQRFFTGDLQAFAADIVAGAAAHRPRTAVGVNAHLVNQMAGDPSFAADLEGVDTLYADGQSVVWGARALDLTVAERIATTDLAPVVVERAAAAGLRIYLLGGMPGVADDAAAALLRDHPAAQITAHHGYFGQGSQEEAEVLADIASWRPEIVFIGMGDPLQLRWATRNRAALGTATVLTSGGLFDWLSGRNVRAPQWMIRAGFEWLWRLFIEPKRLWRRYVIGNPAFVVRVARSRRALRRRTAVLARRAVPSHPTPVLDEELLDTQVRRSA
jgi:N-acetylglucosaminyldiphosphoundecaprenol N-acetyl-beta-D-mannosaminyltransferase